MAGMEWLASTALSGRVMHSVWSVITLVHVDSYNIIL